MRNWTLNAFPSFPSEQRKPGYYWMRTPFAELPEIQEGDNH